MISKDLGRRGCSASHGRRGCTSSCRRCTARCSTPARELLTVGEMPGVTVEEARLFTDPARAELDMVFQFEHVAARPGREQVGPAAAGPARAEGVARPLAGRAGRRGLEQPVLGQPRPAARGVPVRRRRAEHRVASAKLLATVLHLHRGTPYVYQGEELGHDERAVRRRRPTSGTSSRSTTTPPHCRRPATRTRCSPRCARKSRDNARTPMQWDDSPNAGFTTGTPWSAGQPELPARSTRPPSGPTRTRCCSTTAR